MSLGTLAPNAKFTGFDDDGTPLAGGLLYTYAAGTTTPEPTYSDVALTVPNANPVVLDAAGRCTLFLSDTSYKFILKRANGTTVWSQDNIAATNVGQIGASGAMYFFFGGDPTSPIVLTAYPGGNTFDKLHAGSSIFQIDSADLVGNYGIQGMLMSVAGDVVTCAIVDLDDGSPDTPLATIQATSLVGALVTSAAMAFAPAGAVKSYGIKVKTAAGSGYVWGVRLVRLS